MQVVLTSLAKTDIDRGFDFYAHSNGAVAIRFVETVLSDLLVGAENGRVYGFLRGDFQD